MFLMIKMLFSAIEFSAIILLCLSLFRIYFRYSIHKVVIIAIILSFVSVYTRDIINEPSFAALAFLITKIVLLTVFFSLPVIFSLLIGIIGTLAAATFESLVVYAGSFFGLFTQNMLQTSIAQFVAHELIVSAVLLLLVYILQKYKLGFHTTNNDALKGYNFILSGILVVAVVAIQLQTLAFQYSAVHLLLPIMLGVLLMIGVYLAYRHNKKLWKNRRERLANRK